MADWWFSRRGRSRSLFDRGGEVGPGVGDNDGLGSHGDAQDFAALLGGGDTGGEPIVVMSRVAQKATVLPTLVSRPILTHSSLNNSAAGVALTRVAIMCVSSR